MVSFQPNKNKLEENGRKETELRSGSGQENEG